MLIMEADALLLVVFVTAGLTLSFAQTTVMSGWRPPIKGFLSVLGRSRVRSCLDLLLRYCDRWP